MINISYESGQADNTCVFKIHIEELFVCKFEHFSPDGLAECLHKAADAVELSEWADFILKNDAKGG